MIFIRLEISASHTHQVNFLTHRDISDMGSKWEIWFSSDWRCYTQFWKCTNLRSSWLHWLAVSEMKNLLWISFIKITLSLHNSIGIKQRKFAQNNLENTCMLNFQMFCGKQLWQSCFIRNNEDSDEPVLRKTFWNKGLRQAKYDTTAACSYEKVEQVYPSILKVS